MKKNFSKEADHHYLVDKSGKAIGVCLSIHEYKALMQQIEDFKDAIDAEEAYNELTQGKPIEEIVDQLLR